MKAIHPACRSVIAVRPSQDGRYPHRDLNETDTNLPARIRVRPRSKIETP
jgi:hypothetical protein